MANNKSYQFTAELKHFKPRIWRRFIIDPNLTLADLGYALICMFEGCGCHLFHFYKERDTYYECAASEEIGFDSPFCRSLDARNFTIAEMFTEVGDKLNFEYDYGDSWEFNIKLEEITNQSTNHPLEVIKGAGYGIVEDCGGIGGLENIVELCKTRRGRAYEEFVAWSSLVEFDISNFDIGMINHNLETNLKAMKEAYETPPEDS